LILFYLYWCFFKSLTEQFAEITGTDTALAQFFLQDRKWDLQVAIELL